MVRGVLVVGGRIVVIQDAKISSCLQPKIIGFARMQPRRGKILRAVRGSRQQYAIDEWRIDAALEGRPTVILQHDDEDGLNRRQVSRSGGETKQQKQQNNWAGSKSGALSLL